MLDCDSVFKNWITPGPGNRGSSPDGIDYFGEYAEAVVAYFLYGDAAK